MKMMTIKKSKLLFIGLCSVVLLGNSTAAVVGASKANLQDISGYVVDVSGNQGILDHDSKDFFSVPDHAAGIQAVIESKNGQKVVVFDNGMGSIVGTKLTFKLPQSFKTDQSMNNGLDLTFNLKPVSESFLAYSEHGKHYSWNKNTYRPKYFKAIFTNRATSGGQVRQFVLRKLDSPFKYWKVRSYYSGMNTLSTDDGLSLLPSQLTKDFLYYSVRSNSVFSIADALDSDISKTIAADKKSGPLIYFYTPEVISFPLGDSPISSNADILTGETVMPETLDSNATLSPYYMTYKFMALRGPYQTYYQNCSERYEKKLNSKGGNSKAASAAIAENCTYTNMPRKENGNMYTGIGPVVVNVSGYDQYGNPVSFSTNFSVQMLPSQLSVVVDNSGAQK